MAGVADYQGVALGFHMLCLWHGTLCPQLVQNEFRSNSNFNGGVPAGQFSRPMDGNRIDFYAAG